MSQNVPIKKIQIAERQKKVSELFLKNVSMTKISEIFGVDRKTVQRDLAQMKFSFGHSIPSEQAYYLIDFLIREHSIIFKKTAELLDRTNEHRDTVEYLTLLKKEWDSKAFFLAKIGVFDCIPSMLDKKHDLRNAIFSTFEKKEETKMTSKDK